MTIPRPGFYFNFANTPGFLDPRLVFQRDSVGTYIDQTGKVVTAPAGAPRWEFDPETGECKGIIIEVETTNKWSYSEEFNQGTIYYRQNVDVTANTAVAPDGATTADTLSVTASAVNNGVLYRSTTVASVGGSIVYSIFAKADSVDYLHMRIADLSGTVACWFNLATQTVGSYTSSGSTVAFAKADIVPLPNGWSRCILGVNTATNLSFNNAVSPSPSDGVWGSAGDSIFIWGAQVEERGTLTAATSYIPTLSSTSVTRKADNLSLLITPANDKWFNTREGTLFFHWECRDTPNTTSVIYGGIGANANDYIFLARQTASTIVVRSVVSTGASVVVTEFQRPFSFETGQEAKVALSWGNNAIKFVKDADSVFSASTNTPTPATTIRASLFFPAQVSTTTTNPYANFKAFAYFPRQLSDTELKLLTS
jgi:hypothetical protein